MTCISTCQLNNLISVINFAGIKNILHKNNIKKMRKKYSYYNIIIILTKNITREPISMLLF